MHLSVVHCRRIGRENILGDFADAGTLDDVDDAVMEELPTHTGFVAWQDGQWLTAAMTSRVSGAAGARELKGKFAQRFPPLNRILTGTGRI